MLVVEDDLISLSELSPHPLFCQAFLFVASP